MAKVLVLHTGYGCDTGCCGHVVTVDDKRVGHFSFEHPYDGDVKEFIKRTVTEQAGAEHVADIDFEHCIVIDD